MFSLHGFVETVLVGTAFQLHTKDSFAHNGFLIVAHIDKFRGVETAISVQLVSAEDLAFENDGTNRHGDDDLAAVLHLQHGGGVKGHAAAAEVN